MFVLTDFGRRIFLLTLSVWSASVVTKVKGLSDLSEKAKVAERETSSKRTRGSANSHERPSGQGRQSSVKVRQLLVYKEN